MERPTSAARAARIATAATALVIALVAGAACGSTTPHDAAGAGANPAATDATGDSSTAGPEGSTGSTGSVGKGDPGEPIGYGGTPGYPTGDQVVRWDVDGVTRTAVLVVPSDLTAPAPLVLAYHGHGGRGSSFQNKMEIEQRWPEAIVVYPDGLVGHKGKTDPEGVRTGWQQDPGDEGGRDLRFYDVMMADLHARLPIDENRIFVVGHSNGSAFTSLLLNQRGDHIAATANLSSQPGRLLDTDPVRSMFMGMGEQDPVVPYENQKRSIPLAEAKLGVDVSGATVDGYLRREYAPGNLELATYVHPAGHEVPAEVPPLVVAFFQRHSLTDAP